MQDDILIDDLVVSPPQVWARRIEQASIIAPLALLPVVRVADAMAASASLGVNQRRIYKLVEQRRSRLKGAPPRGNLTGLPYYLEPQKEAVIAQAIAEAGSAARLRDVRARAAELSADLGIQCPTTTSIRTRFGKSRDPVDLLSRMGLDCDLVIDHCPLAASVFDDFGTAAVIWFLAIIDPKTCQIRAHTIFAGQPNDDQIQAFLSTCLSASEIKRRKLRVIFSGRDRFGRNFAKPSNRRKIPSGEAIRAMFGKYLGRIPIRSNPKDTGQLSPPVDLALAREIINRTIANGE